MDDEHEHDAEVAPLYVCRTEVTRAQWRSVMDTVPAECEYGCDTGGRICLFGHAGVWGRWCRLDPS